MKPLLVGEANPYQSDPRLAQRFALYPDPPGCAGWRLCHKVMQLDPDDYLARFDRVNLCDGKWSIREARQRAVELVRRSNTESPVDDRPYFVLFGSKVCAAFVMPFDPFRLHAESRYVILPHPSGLSRAWNEPGAYERARAVLREAGVL